MVTRSLADARALIVGGAGFVGSNLAHTLLDLGIGQLTIVDNLLSADMANVPHDERVVVVPFSITEEQVLRALPDDLDFVWHLSCFHGNQSSIAAPLVDHENNTLTSLKLFERLKEIKTLQAVVYAAAGCAVAEKTYDEPAATLEDAPVSLYHDSPYSISKLIGELYGNYYFHRHGLPFVKARFQNVYGPREMLGAGRWRGTHHTVWRNVVPTFVFKSLHEEALPLDNGGDASRDFIFVEDICRGLIACATKGEAGAVYNLASGVETTILDLANTINRLTGNPVPAIAKPRRDWDTSGRRFGDTAKSREQLGFEAGVSLEDGLARTVEWTRAHMGEIKRCMAQHEVFVPEVAGYLSWDA